MLRSVSVSSIYRCLRAGLIVKIPGANDDHFDHDITHKLTEAGRAAAAEIEISIERAIAPPKKRAPKPERTPEERKLDKRKGYLRAELKDLAQGTRRLVRTPTNEHGYSWWEYHPMDTPWVYSRYNSTCRDLDVLMPLLEEFESPVDGRLSLRANAEGLDIIAKRKPLPDTLDYKA